MAEVTADQETAFDCFMKSLLGGGGVRIPCEAALPDGNGMIRIRKGGDFRLIGAHVADSVVKSRGRGVIRMDKAQHIYRCGSGYMGRSSEIKLDFSRSPLELFAVFDQKQPSMKFSAPSKAGPGEHIEFNFLQMSAGRMIHLEVFDPSGKPMRSRNLVLNTAESKRLSFPFSYDDLPGIYRFRAVELLTGSACEQEIKLQQP